MAVESARQGDDLHHRPGFVDVGDDRIDEARGRRGGEVVGVVARHVGPGYDPAGLWLHDDQRAALRLVFLDAVGESSLRDHLDGAVQRQLQGGPIDRVATLAITQNDRLVGEVSHGCLETGLAAEHLVVVGFDPVVALPRVVREAQQIRRQRGAGDTAVDIGTLGFCDLADSGEAKSVELLRHRGGYAPGQVDEFSRGRQFRLDLIRSELQHRRQPAGDVLPLGRGDQVRRGEDREHRRVGHEQCAVAVENVAPHRGQGHGVIVVGGSESGHVVMP